MLQAMYSSRPATAKSTPPCERTRSRYASVNRARSISQGSNASSMTSSNSIAVAFWYGSAITMWTPSFMSRTRVRYRSSSAGAASDSPRSDRWKIR